MDTKYLVAGLCLSLLAISCPFGVGATDARVRIIEPQSGAVFRPGDTFRVRVEVDPELLPGKIWVSGADAHKNGMGATLNGPPFEGQITVPLDASGFVSIDAVLVEPGIGFKVASEAVTFNVRSTEAPQRLEVQSQFQLSLEPLGPELAELRSRIKATGHFEDEIRRDISGPEFGTTYTSLTPDIVSVSTEGRITTIRPGNGFVAVENGGLRQYSRIVIDDAQGRSPTAEDKTTSVAIHASGFRRDPDTGFFTQQLTLRNISDVPLAKAINLIIDDLPEGVELKGTLGRPNPPLSGQIVHVDVSEDDFLSPGGTATATLKFTNREGVPITYTRKVYCGKRP